MKAIVHDGFGDLSVLKMAQLTAPPLQAGQIRIAVRSSGLNRADLLQRRGLYPPPFGESDVPGLEASGEIVEVASDVLNFHQGDRVMSLLAGGGYAEQVCVDSGLAVVLPSHFTFEEGAAIPETFFTAHHNLFTLGEVKKGDTVLLHAGGSGVGTSALQLLQRRGIKVFTTVGTEEKAEFCKSLGARPILYRNENFSEIVREETEGKGVDVILDCVGGSYFEQNIRSLSTNGRMVVIGTLGGREGKLDLSTLLSKRIRIIGSTLRSLPLEDKRQVVLRFSHDFGQALGSGDLRPIVDSIFPAVDVQNAQARMECNANLGKIVLKWS